MSDSHNPRTGLSAIRGESESIFWVARVEAAALPLSMHCYWEGADINRKEREIRVLSLLFNANNHGSSPSYSYSCCVALVFVFFLLDPGFLFVLEAEIKGMTSRGKIQAEQSQRPRHK